MRIRALTVCVDYWDFLVAGFARWLDGLESWTIITSEKDHVQGYFYHPKVTILRTDLFYRDGATFNKGRAMEWARKQMSWQDWILFVDADVAPPEGWSDIIEARSPKPGFLYGCTRVECTDAADLHKPVDSLPKMPHDVPGVGFFQLFHSADGVTKDKPPLIDTHWLHGGNYDNRFMDRWRRRGLPIQSLPLKLYHVGERDNWFGRGETAKFEAMQAERKRRGGRWDHECLPTIPID